MKKQYLFYTCLLFASIFFLLNSCSKGGGSTPPPAPCTGVTVSVSATTTNPTASGSPNGTINASASGASGSYTFSINGGVFQASGNFTGLVAGSYTITAKSSAGCTGTATFTLVNPVATCTGVTITISATSTNATPCSSPSTGSISATATGSTGITYSINGSTFQASGNFSNVAAGSYTVTAKDANGCTGTTNVTVGTNSAGPLFLAVKDVLTTNCVSCHNNSQQEGGMNWTVDCNIVQFKARILDRAVTQGTMPPTGPLPQSEKNKITAWINAGGRYSD